MLPQDPDWSAHSLLHVQEQRLKSAAAASACCQAHEKAQLLPHASRSSEAAAHLSSGLFSLLALLIVASQDDGSCGAGLVGEGVIIVKHLLESVTCGRDDLAPMLLLPLAVQVLEAQSFFVACLQAAELPGWVHA